MLTLAFATQEPYGTYHLAPFAALGHRLIHIQPRPFRHPANTFEVEVADCRDALAQADALIITGGLTTRLTEAAAQQAGAAGLPVMFAELAYPTEFSKPSLLAPDMLVATTASGLARYRAYLPQAKVHLIETHLALVGLPPHVPSSHPRVLIGTSVSAELPDGSAGLLAIARELQAGSDVELLVSTHPREDSARWGEFEVTSGTTLAEDLAGAWGFIAYQTTAFLTSEAMGVPSFYPGSEPWQRTLLPPGYASAEQFDESTLQRILERKPQGALAAPSASSARWEHLIQLLLRSR